MWNNTSGVLCAEVMNWSWNRSIHPLPNDKILEVTKLNAFADNKLNVAKMANSLFNRVENAVGKGENAGYQQFFFFSFPKVFSKAFFLKVIKSQNWVVKR